jgi:uncharacterized membrane protein YdjX (TVP38/TMEM64 family)
MSNAEDPTIDEDTAEDIQQDIDDADEDVTRTQRWWAYAQLAALFGGVILAGVAAVAFGIVDPSITVSATVDIGWVVEYAIIGFVGAFLLYVFALILIALPGSILSLLGGLAFGVASAGGYIDDEEGGE